jgi:hypothetical protein
MRRETVPALAGERIVCRAGILLFGISYPEALP